MDAKIFFILHKEPRLCLQNKKFIADLIYHVLQPMHLPNNLPLPLIAALLF